MQKMNFLVTGLKVETLEEWRKNFANDGKLRLAQNVCTKQGPLETCRNRSAEQSEVPHIFKHKVRISLVLHDEDEEV